MDQVTDIASKLGAGGRLYSDARPIDDEPIQASLLFTPPWLNEIQPEPKGNKEAADKPAPKPEPKPEPKPDTKPKNWREIRSTTTELVGIGFVTAGFWEIQPWAGLIVLGLCLTVLGVAMDFPTRADDKDQVT